MSTASAATSEIATYHRLFDVKYRELYELLADLPDEALLWKPFEESPWKGPCSSLGYIAAHSVSATIYLLRRAQWTMGRREWNEVEGDEGSEEFGPANHRLTYLQGRIRRTQDLVDEILDGMDETDLDHSRAHPDSQRELTVRYDIQHAIEHMSQHIGHGQLTRQLWALDDR